MSNNVGKKALDIAISMDNLCTTLKLIEDKRFNNIDVISFTNLYNKFIKSEKFGKYSRLTNLEIVIKELSKKTKLLPRMEELVDLIKNYELKQELSFEIKQEIFEIFSNISLNIPL